MSRLPRSARERSRAARVPGGALRPSRRHTRSARARARPVRERRAFTPSKPWRGHPRERRRLPAGRARTASRASTHFPRPGTRRAAHGRRADLAREALPARRDLRRRGDELRGLRAPRRGARPVPLRPGRPRPGAAPRAGLREDRARLARLPARRPAGRAVRVPRPRPLRAGERPALQPVQAARRPVRPRDLRRGRPLGADLRLPAGRAGAGPRLRRPGRRRRGAEVRRGGEPLRLGERPPARDALAPLGDLRGPREGLHRPSPRGAARAARHLPGLRVAPGGRAPREARRHRGGAPPRPRAPGRPLPEGEGAHELLGLLHARLLRAGAAVRPREPRGAGHGVPRDGQGAPRRGHRGDPRRRLQPHRRGEPPRADPVA